MLTTSGIVKAGVVVVAPLLACLGYYATTRLANPSGLMAFGVGMAAPLALICAAWTFMLLTSGTQQHARHRTALMASCVGAVVPTVFLLIVWAQKTA